jgi:hypothetical protein
MPNAMRIPDWFRRTSIYADMQRHEQAQREAIRTTLASERARLLASEAKDAPKRARLVDDARDRVHAARQALTEAEANYTTVQATQLSAGYAPSRRLGAIASELQSLADPAIAEARRRVVAALERARLAESGVTARNIGTLRAALSDLDALALTANTSAPERCAEILTTAGLSIQSPTAEEV